MKRHFFVSQDLDDLELVEQELQARGVDKPHMHVLSNDDCQVQLHHLNDVEAVLRKDVVRATEIGAVIGVIAAALVLLVAYLLGATNTAAGWLPFILLSIVVLGFCTWEGGFLGIQATHHDFKRFQNAMDSGKHIFFVDINAEDETILNEVADAHPRLRNAGEGQGRPAIVVGAQKRWTSFMTSMP
jgi:hypothetical protein|tara:strand:- start:1547 stop:2104 length:558 start_codon:yes stop_codon:yes gene_type:complete